jgi:quaternary ammonium compound-resistance protein SugE
MAWVILMVSGAMEAVWAVALSQSEGFTKLKPSILFFVGLALSMGGLGYALRSIPVGTGYAVWVGIGAVTTAAWSLARGYEAVTGLKIFFLLGIVACVIGLQLVSTGKAD